MGLLRTIQPDWWFSAHLHVRYEATVYHDGRPPGFDLQQQRPSPSAAAPPVHVAIQNPDEIAIDDEDFEVGGPMEAESTTKATEKLPEASLPPRNSDEIVLSDEEEEVVVVPPPSGPVPTTKFLALDKCLPRRDFLEVHSAMCNFTTPADLIF